MITIHEAGPLLFGPSWQTPLAQELGLSVRTVARWAAGERRVLPEQWDRIAVLMRGRRLDLAAALMQMRENVEHQRVPNESVPSNGSSAE